MRIGTVDATGAASPARPQAPAVPAAGTAEPAGPARLLNPQPVIDPALGLVVTEYFNREGEMTSQFPSARALDSYRIYGLKGDPDRDVPPAAG